VIALAALMRVNGPNASAPPAVAMESLLIDVSWGGSDLDE
jgi:hypothetical protein